jgi:medium-chain acyl-[acyl-carrier-protein] hydrolase
MGKRYAKEYTVPYYDSDVNGLLKIPAMLNIALQISGLQSAELGRSDAFVATFGLTWVVTHYEVNVTRLPNFNETVTIETEAENYNKFFCYRSFWFKDVDGNELIHIFSTFVLMDLEERKMSQVLEEIIAPYESEKIKKIHRAPAIAPIKNGESVPYRVRFSDIDANKHVNNSKYFDWMTDTLGYDFLTTHSVKTINLRFVKEVEFGKMVDSVTEIVDEEGKAITRHRIDVDGNDHAEAEITWNTLASHEGRVEV